ncbi:MAG: sensor domain-containing diguanylate cyclase [Xylophilus ampelinus]
MRSASSARSLGTRIALVFGALVILVATGLTAVLGGMLSARIRHDTEGALRLTADNITATLRRNLDLRINQAVVMGRSEALWAGGLDSPAARAALRRIQEYQPENRRAEVAAADGRLQAAHPRRRIGQDVSAEEWFSRGVRGAAVSARGRPAEGARDAPGPTDEPVGELAFSAPVLVEGRVAGVFAVHTSWDWVRAAVEQYLPADSTAMALDVAIFDRDGTLLYAVGGQAEALRAAGQALPMAGGPPGSVRWADGIEYLTAVSAARPSEKGAGIAWTVAVRRPAHEAYRDARRAIAATLVIGLLAAIAAAGVAALAARRIGSDLSRIVDALQDVENGVPGASIPLLDSSKEMHVLSHALSRVTTRLLRSREEMERQVRLRTLELEAANRELDLQARSDPLTGLLNRRGLSDHLDPALALAARGERGVSIVVLDADHFKRVNDRFGHAVGDDVLRHLASLLRQRLRASDVAARVGGEEFVVLLPGTDPAGAEPLAQQLIDSAAAHPHPVCGPLTLSAGVAGHRPGDDAQSLFRRADRALYAAKAAGRNRVCVADPYGDGSAGD